MYPDFIFETFRMGVKEWALFAIGYGIFDYIFNLVMCIITGGVQKLKNRKRRKSEQLINHLRIFINGGQERVKEFRLDPLSWIWPITNLAIPILLYGITKNSINATLQSLTLIGVNLDNYEFLAQFTHLQLLAWVVAAIEGLVTVFRYHHQRSSPTFFSRSIVFSTMRVILFNIPIGYAILNIIFTIVDFSGILYKVLSDNAILYNFFHSDQMFGLKTSYNAIIGISFILIIISFLPTIILIREGGEKYSKIYRLGFYSGIISTFLLMGFLIVQFGQRVGSIKQIALASTLLSPLNTLIGDVKTLVALEYYKVVTNFPDSFPVPTWLSTLLVIRIIVLGFEVYEIFSTKKRKFSIRDVLKSLFSKL